MAIPFLTGQRLTADLLNTNIGDFMPTTYTKSLATTRTSITTYADDPELSGIALGAGTWEVELLLYFSQNTATTSGIKTQWAFTGSWTSTAIRGVSGPGANNTAGSNQADTMNSRAFWLNGQDAIYNQAFSAAYGHAREISRTVTVSVAGNLSLQWAQVVSSANGTVVQPSSTFNIRKIS